MELFTGKAKELFEEWFFNKTKYEYSVSYLLLLNGINTNKNIRKDYHAFICSPPSYQWGVILEFAIFNGIHIDLNWQLDDEYEVFIDRKSYTTQLFIGYKEAQLEAIKQLNIILNR